MNEILGIQVPASFDGLPADEVNALIAQVREAALAALRQEQVDPAKVAEAEKATAFVREGKAYLASLAEQEDEANDVIDALEAELTEDGGDVDPGDAPEEGDESDDESDDEDAETESEPVSEADTEPEPVAASMPIRRRRPTARQMSEQVPAERLSLVPERAPMVILPGNTGLDAGGHFESTTALSDALQQRWRQVGSSGSDERFGVARINANYPAELHLVAGDNGENIARFGGLDLNTDQAQSAITAAVCAPATPYYGLGCQSSDARPVWASLPKYQAPRGNVSVYPSPKLSDLGGPGVPASGMGIWTQEDDANPNAVKNACAVIPCATPTQYGIYGAYACITIKNMMAMTYPELVEAYLNKLGALFARMREQALLDGILASTNLVELSDDATGESASIHTWATILNLLEGVREMERYDDAPALVGWAPRWVREALRVDLLRQRRDGASASSRIASRAEVDAAFNALGVSMTWTYDNPSGNEWQPFPSLDDGGNVPVPPTTANFIFSPRGNFRALDGGNLTIGVTNNNIYRDNESNRRNQFTIFMENFEGIIDFGCPSYTVSISNFCPNGAQVADIEPIAC